MPDLQRAFYHDKPGRQTLFLEKTNKYYGENKWRMNILVTLSAK